MKRNLKRIITLAVLTVFGFSTMAFAGWGSGCYSGMGRGRDDWGSGRGHMCGYGSGNGYSGYLSPAQLYQLEQERAEFLRETEDLRQNLYSMDLELRSELIKENPDAARISELKSEISKLQSELYQKSLDFDIRARNTVPGYNGGYLGHCPMMGGMW